MLKFIEKWKEKREETRIRRQKRREAIRLSCIKIDVAPFYSSNYSENPFIDLITVSFNNPIIVEYQIKLFKKYINGSYTHIVCDNSNNEESAKLIREVCEKNDVTYINITSTEKANGFSDSHGRALNRVYNNVVKERQNNFALLDHDIMPIKPVEIEEYLKTTELYGRVEERAGIWYLWPGFSFFKYDYVKDKKLRFRRYRKWHFLKVEGADTGSANWFPLYSKFDKSKIVAPDILYWNFNENRPIREDETFDTKDFYEYYLDKSWVHVGCASEWKNCGNKNQIIYSQLDEHLGLCNE